MNRGFSQSLALRILSPGLASGLFFAAPAHAESAFGDSHGTIARVDDPAEETKSGDGVYGRFNGDMSLQIGAGVEAEFSELAFRPALHGDFMLYQTAGLYGSYRKSVSDEDPAEQVASVGLQLAPLFLIRWPRAWESGPALLDLTVDSLSLYAGAHFTHPRGGDFAESIGLETGLSLGVPLLGRANGLWLRSRGGVFTAEDEWSGSAWLYLSWQGFVHTGLLEVD
jgi:hypothetical protein